MFVSSSSSDAVLPAKAYCSQEYLDIEIEELFRREWQLIGTMSQLPRDGSYVTRSFLDMPLILVNDAGSPRLFLNVCPHRNAMLVHQPRGVWDRISCPYHGWTYNRQGKLCGMPNAAEFRPLQREGVQLREFDVERCGQLVFARFSASGRALSEYLGPFYEELQHNCGAEAIEAWTASYQAPCNWKVIAENNVESYHVGTVHARSLGPTPPEQTCAHELGPGYSKFSVVSDAAIEKPNLWHRLYRRSRTQEDVAGVYRHVLIHPNLMFGGQDRGVLITAIWPESPASSCVWLHGFYRPPAGASQLKTWLLVRGVRLYYRYWSRVICEDRGIFPRIQSGMQAAWRFHGPPMRLSRREERCLHLQQGLAELYRQAGLPHATPPSPGSHQEPERRACDCRYCPDAASTSPAQQHRHGDADSVI